MKSALEFCFSTHYFVAIPYLSYGIYQNISASEQVHQWFALYSWVGVIVLVAWALSLSEN